MTIDWVSELGAQDLIAELDAQALLINGSRVWGLYERPTYLRARHVGTVSDALKTARDRRAAYPAFMVTSLICYLAGRP